MSDNFSKKPEKLASAVYLISNFFVDQEPMKWRLRTLASDMVSLSTVQKNEFYTDENRVTADIRQTASELSALLDVARDAGLVSDTNHSILSKELLNYMNILGLPEEVSELFRLPEKGLTLNTDSQGQTLGRETEKDISIKDKSIKDTLKLKEFGAVSVKKNNRKSVIIGLLKRKKEIIIKDVAPLISGVSEKTIQRELLSMVREGILVKQGEKRWSRYSLA